MCIIVYNREGKQLDKDLMRVAYENNPHGYGIMWYDGDRVGTLKEDDGGFDSLWATVQKFNGTPYALHLRWRTRGVQSQEQCHPHLVTSKDDGEPEDVMLMHNGTLPGFGTHDIKSDTSLFAEKLRRIMQLSDHDFNDSLDCMGEHITKPNRLLFMDSQGGVTFVNEDQGTWIEDVWYSNLYSFEPGYRDDSSPDLWTCWSLRRERKRQEGLEASLNYWASANKLNYQEHYSNKPKKKSKRRQKKAQRLRRQASFDGAQQQTAASSLPAGRHVDRHGNVTLVTESGKVVRIR